MRSYYAHLETTAKPTDTPISPKPTFRSSAIFPVYNFPSVQSRILFMGYWILKRHIHEISAVVSLRNEAGTLISRKNFLINEARTYRIELADQLENAGMSRDAVFKGSLEVEFFSVTNLMFPYPAVAINYYGPAFSSVVHTAQRVYNDFEDMKRNTQTDVPESGFNIYADDETEPFIGLINGAEGTSDSYMDLTFFNSDQKTLSCRVHLGTLAPYQTITLFPAQHADLQTFLQGKVGACKAKFHVNWIFPRLLVGNFHRQLPAYTITHTYYDCTEATASSNYWSSESSDNYPAALMIPAPHSQNHFTHVYFYPIYSPSAFLIDLELYTQDGSLLVRKKEVLKIESPSNRYYKLELKAFLAEAGIEAGQEVGARIIARRIGNGPIPARIKLALDIGTKKKQLSCNICTNLQPYNPGWDKKPSTFKWAPILADRPRASVWIMNSNPAMTYTTKAVADVLFHRERDTKTLNRKYNLPPHGFVVIRPDEDPELLDFFEGTVGWFTSSITAPYATTYYFSENESGVIGGDHGF